jgi:hypothetical protein
MVVVYVKLKGKDKFLRESFANPRHYIKWRKAHSEYIESVRPVRSWGRRP